MSADPLSFALRTPGHLWFQTNQPFGKDLTRAGGRVAVQSSGHLVVYRSDGRRILATDPAGNPLHECEWTQDGADRTTLSRVRIKLDWGQWVGIVSGGLVNEIQLNLATRPGWQKLRPDDLRAMAAQALRVPLDEVRWFYKDEDLSISPAGLATIRQWKDAFYLLDEEGGFGRARFMSCMGAMHWASIDFLPVVELFKSLLPGTGSAAFELIRGLYDDQNVGRSQPMPLRYRGIPTYPSDAAYRLFSSFFSPSASSSRDPYELFMDQTRSHLVSWLPSPTPPLRYFDRAQGCCLTFQGGVLVKATFADDPSGLSYAKPRENRFVLCDRTAIVTGNSLTVRDRQEQRTVPVELPPGAVDSPMQPSAVSPVDWRSMFAEGVPPISAGAAYGAVPLYPDDESEIDELSAQPFVADYLQDLAEQDRDLGALLARAERILIENGDAVAATCVSFDRPRAYQIRMRVPAFAQKQAQQLWNVSAELQRWDWLTQIRFVPMAPWRQNPASHAAFDVAYVWVPVEVERDRLQLLTLAKELRLTLRSGGTAFVTGPTELSAIWGTAGFRTSWQELVEHLPTFRMHRTILPKARLKPGLTLYCVTKI